MDTEEFPSAESRADDSDGEFVRGALGIFPRAFSALQHSAGTDFYLRDPAARVLLEFFEGKGLDALKEEDRRERWYDDWLAFQARHRLYATVLSPRQYCTGIDPGAGFDLLRYARFLEVFAYCSPAHGYSLQVTFLGFFAILMGTNEALKHEAVALLDAGKVLAFGVSEQGHGSDLMANEFRVAPHPAGAGQWITSGSKYYIGNANAAAIIATLGHEEAGAAANDDVRGKTVGRAPFILVALRPQQAGNNYKQRKIHTLGVRAAHVGAFDMTDYVLPEGDVIARGRQAWDAIFGTVKLGKFFLGFGAIGICEHALHEAATHLRKRILYGKSAIEMPHLLALMAQAYARLLAMKLYAYRTLDYVHAASAKDRRYQLFCAVQKAKVSTEGVKVVGLISECIGAKGFEADTYCEMALRDVALLPGLEGSMHINLGLAVQFLPRYFQRDGAVQPEIPSLWRQESRGQKEGSGENPYLMAARTGGTHAIEFAWFLDAYRPHAALKNVALFVRQAAAFRRWLQTPAAKQLDKSNMQISVGLGHCLATIAYGQLVAENAALLSIPQELISVIFGLLVTDLSNAAMQLASIPSVASASRAAIIRMIQVPRTSAAEWDRVAVQFDALCAD